MTTQIAVKLPDETVATLDRLVGSGRYANRSEAVRAGLALVFERATSDAIDRAYAAGYARHPETEEELADATRLAIESINEEPWERWW